MGENGFYMRKSSIKVSIECEKFAEIAQIEHCWVQPLELNLKTLNDIKLKLYLGK